MEVKIQIPDNCELIKDGNTYVVREKKQIPPKSWEEFCERYPVKKGEAYLLPSTDGIFTAEENYTGQRLSKIWCTSEEEAEAFLALMQLRQLRKAWVGDWEQPEGKFCAGILCRIYPTHDEVAVSYATFWTNIVLSFPTPEMAKDFLSCFKDLCEKAKILL